MIRNGDVGLNVEVDGDDAAPPVLVMHGILGSHRTWDWMVPRLVDRYRVVRLDFRGHGASDRAAGRYQLSDYVSDAVAACDQVVGGTCVLIGHSLGGGVAAGLAQQHPSLVSGVVLEDAPLTMPDPDSPDRSELLDTFALLRDAIPQFQAAGMSVDDVAPVVAASPSASGGILGELLHDDAVRTMAASMLDVDASVLDRVLDGSLSSVFDPQRSIEAPTVVVAADPNAPDSVTKPADIDQLSVVSPHATAHTLAGAGHLIHDLKAHREEFFAIVDGFLDSLTAGS